MSCVSTKSSVLKESDDGCAQCQKRERKNTLNEVIALWTGKTHWQEISCQHSPCTDPQKTYEKREKTGWKGG